MYMATLSLFYGPKNQDRAQEQYGFRLVAPGRNFTHILPSYDAMVEALKLESLDYTTIKYATGKVPSGNSGGYFYQFHFDPMDKRQVEQVISALNGSK